MKQAVQVTILGQPYMVRTEAPAEEVRRVAEFVNEKLAEVSSSGRIVNTLDVVVLTLLNVAGMYLNERGDISGCEVEQRLGALLQRLEAFPSQSAPD